MRHANKLLAAFAVAIALLYVGLYYATVDYALFEVRTIDHNNVFWRFEPEPTYRFGGGAAKVIFFPMHELDRRLRPATWSESQVPLIY